MLHLPAAKGYMVLQIGGFLEITLGSYLVCSLESDRLTSMDVYRSVFNMIDRKL